MSPQFRPARAGDICILLLPDDDEVSRVKWEVEVTDELRRYVALTDRALDEMGVSLSERYADDWISTWVTALDGDEHGTHR